MRFEENGDAAAVLAITKIRPDSQGRSLLEMAENSKSRKDISAQTLKLQAGMPVLHFLRESQTSLQFHGLGEIHRIRADGKRILVVGNSPAARKRPENKKCFAYNVMARDKSPKSAVGTV